MKTISSFIRRILGNLQVRILLIILVFLFTPVLITLNNYFRHTEGIILKNTSSLMMDNLQQVGDKIENICVDMITLSNILLTDDTVLDNLSADPASQGYKNDFKIKDPYQYTIDDYLRISRVENRLNSVKRNIFFNNKANIIIIGTDGTMYFSMDNLEEEYGMRLAYTSQVYNQDWFKKVALGERKAIWDVPYEYGAKKSEKNRHISIVKSIRNKYSPKDVAGVLMIDFSEENIEELIGNSFNHFFALVNENGRVIFCSHKYMEDKILTNREIASKNLFYGKGSFITEIDHTKYMVNYNSIYRFGLSAISIVPYAEITKEINLLQMKINSMNILIFSAFLFLGTSLLLNTIYPIQKLLKRMKKMKVGAYSVEVSGSESLDDVNGLVHSFDTMLNRIEELVAIVVQEQKQENDLRYEALRAQINPHFLFNTLSTIKWSAKMSGANNVSKTISALGRLLEVSINKGEEEICFSEEFELVKCYVYIQNVRYNDKFELQLKVEDEKIYSYKVPKLILQPIVENSIIHGFGDMADNCVIKIDAYGKGESVIIDVIDNGTGIDKDRLEELMHSKDAKQKFSGIGLKNVHERIRLKYGDQYGISINSVAGEGTTVSIAIPKLEDHKEEEVGN